MNRNSVLTVAILAGLLIVSGILSAVLPGALQGGSGLGGPGGLEAPSFDTYDIPTVEVNAPFALPGVTLVPGVEAIEGVTGGYTMTPLAIILIITGAVIGPVIVTGIILYFLIGRLLTNATENVKTSDQYQQYETQVQAREREFVNKYKSEQPPDEVPDHYRPGYSAAITAVVIAALFGFLGAALGANFGGSGALTSWTLGATGLGLVIGLLAVRRSTVQELDATDNKPIDWGIVWVVLTGVIMIGLGIGLMMVVRSGDPAAALPLGALAALL